MKKDYSAMIGEGRSSFRMKDKSGTYYYDREVSRQGKDYHVQNTVYIFENGSKKILETATTVSTFGYLKKIPIFRPKKSKFDVWFDKQKYSNEMRINVSQRAMDVKLTSPETQWSGTKRVAFPRGTGAFCYFNQVMECAKITGFIEKAIEKKAGQMVFHLIWEGFPYIQEQYLNLPSEIFSSARLIYDGTNKKQEHRFTLEVAGQSIFYFVDKKRMFSRMYWVSQGVSIVKAL